MTARRLAKKRLEKVVPGTIKIDQEEQLPRPGNAGPSGRSIIVPVVIVVRLIVIVIVIVIAVVIAVVGLIVVVLII